MKFDPERYWRRRRAESLRSTLALLLALAVLIFLGFPRSFPTQDSLPSTKEVNKPFKLQQHEWVCESAVCDLRGCAEQEVFLSEQDISFVQDSGYQVSYVDCEHVSVENADTSSNTDSAYG